MQHDHKTLAELHSLGIGIPVRSHPYKSSVFSRHSIIGSVPSAAEISCLEYQGTITVINSEQIFRHIAGMEWPESSRSNRRYWA